MEMKELNVLSGKIVDAAYRVHVAIGPGLKESVYERVLAGDLSSCGLYVERQKPISFDYNGMWFENVGYADLVVEKCLTVEIKSVSAISVVHSKQLLTYLRLQEHRLGLLLNFGAAYMKDGIKRIINGF